MMFALPGPQDAPGRRFVLPDIPPVHPVVKRCSRCHETVLVTAFARKASSRDGLQPFCRPCNRSYCAGWAASAWGKLWKALYDEEDPIKAECRRRTREMIRNGSLTRGPCAVSACTAHRVHAHHTDYTRPDLVTWLCAAHHLSLHSGLSPLDPAPDVIQDHGGQVRIPAGKVDRLIAAILSSTKDRLLRLVAMNPAREPILRFLDDALESLEAV